MPHKGHHSKTLGAFAKRVAAIAPKIENLSHEYKKAVAMRMHERLVMATPVDTSAALSNWQIATLATGPVQMAIPAFYAGSQGSTVVASVSATLQAAMVPLKTAAPGYPIVISNVIDYIGDLAYPPYRSQQAQYDWVDLAMTQGARQGVTEVNTKVVW